MTRKYDRRNNKRLVLWGTLIILFACMPGSLKKIIFVLFVAWLLYLFIRGLYQRWTGVVLHPKVLLHPFAKKSRMVKAAGLLCLLFFMAKCYERPAVPVPGLEVGTDTMNLQQERPKDDVLRVATVNRLTKTASALQAKKKYKQALVLIDSAILFAAGNQQLILDKAKLQHDMGQYKQAVGTLDNMAPLSEDGHLLRARCYIKTGNTKDAVADLKAVTGEGSNEATRLYNKINPLRKRITGYITRCCDGSTSFARGRGACSHHGGVCDWNEPVYETYRNY